MEQPWRRQCSHALQEQAEEQGSIAGQLFWSSVVMEGPLCPLILISKHTRGEENSILSWQLQRKGISKVLAA